MRKILGLTVAALLVMGLVGGGTWAYFSDTQTSTGNTLTAGTLDLGLHNDTSDNTSTDSVTGTFSASDWAPGDTTTGTLYVNNNGSITMGTVNATISVVSFTEGTPTTVTGFGGTADSDNISKMIYISTATWNGTSVAALASHTLDSIDGLNIQLGSLPANTELPLVITWNFDTSATNGCQGDAVDVTLEIVGNQQ